MSDWPSFPFTHDGVTRDVYAYSGNSGRRGILLMHELGGITDQTLRFAEFLASENADHPGFDVFLPAFFGRLRQSPKLPGVAKGLFQTACVRAEFRAMQSAASSPIAGWLRALSRNLGERTGGPVGVVGMCLSGGVVFSMVWDPAVQAVVAAQPSLPFKTEPGQTTVSAADFDAAMRRATAEPIEILLDDGAKQELPRVQVHRFTTDSICPAERVDELRARWESGASPESVEVLLYPADRKDHATLTEGASRATAEDGRDSRTIVRTFFEGALR